MIVGGSALSTKKYWFEVAFAQCETNCTGYENFLDKGYIQMFFANRYFNFYDLTDPIKTYFDDKTVMYASLSMTAIMDVRIRTNQYTLNDNILLRNPSEVGEFLSFSYDLVQTRTKLSTDTILCQIRFSMDDRIDIHERTVTTLFDVIGTVGGFFEISEVILAILVSYCANRFYEISITKHLERMKEGNTHIHSSYLFIISSTNY